MKIPILCRQRAIAENCWMIVRDTGMEKVDDAEQEEYLKRWMEITV